MKKILLMVLILGHTAWSGLFDDRFPSARATAVSNSVVAIVNDVWASYYNPAGLAEIKSYLFGASYQTPFNLSYFKNYFLSGVYPLPGNYGCISLSFQNFAVKYQGNELSAENTIAFSHGFYLMKDMSSSLSAGYSLKYYHWSLGESIGGVDLGSGGTFGFDVGMQASIYNRTYVGVYFLNLNAPKIGDLTKHELPQRLVIGAAYRPQNEITTTIAINKTIGMETQLEGGFDFQIMEMIALRLGVSTQPNRFSGGIGLNYQNFFFDYAVRTHPVLAETHQFGLSYIF